MVPTDADDHPAAQSDKASVPERIEIHNPSVNGALADRGACAHVHLPTGRTCVLPLHHPGSCDFVPADEVPS
ncbi:hypothetical protein [Actinoplanes couchii]|uniref:Uncharacterized protein n=1 Tax=Actinoplanes couchii TaxID=403638 RepID=A0ABQ3XT53_9ACTN|nr:hypothetical protein [Actinoplanes couchii]MDR6324549.1 hypothetical protein [Actinoplanes couchii]GID61686.1 hypothetical protein Aco03nite_100900 [Actinoplanes couchii]